MTDRPSVGPFANKGMRKQGFLHVLLWFVLLLPGGCREGAISEEIVCSCAFKIICDTGGFVFESVPDLFIKATILKSDADTMHLVLKLYYSGEEAESSAFELPAGIHQLISLDVCDARGDVLLSGIPERFSFICGSGGTLPYPIETGYHPIIRKFPIAVSHHEEIQAWEINWIYGRAEVWVEQGWSLMVYRQESVEENSMIMTVDVLWRNRPNAAWRVRIPDLYQEKGGKDPFFRFADDLLCDDHLEGFRIQFDFPDGERWEGLLSVARLLEIRDSVLNTEEKRQLILLPEDADFHKIEIAFPNDPSDPFLS